MKRTITLTEIIDDGSLCVKFDDKQFGTPSLQELLEFSQEDLQEIANRLLRSLLIIEYMKQPRLPISASLDTDDVSGIVVVING